MTDPLRWTEDGATASAMERELLSAGQGVGPSAAERQEAWAAILVQTAAGAAASAGAASGLAASSSAASNAPGVSAAAGQSMAPGVAQVAPWSLGSKIIGVAAFLGALGGGYWATMNDKPPPGALPSDASSSPSPVRQRVFVDVANPATNPQSKASVPRSAASPGEGAVTDHDLPAPANAREASSASLPSAKETSPPRAEEKPLSEQQLRASRLREESLAVLEVRRTLRGGNPQAALSLLAQARRDFPAGALGQEREALTIEALASSGARAEAARRAQSFLEDYPKSPLASDVKKFATP